MMAHDFSSHLPKVIKVCKVPTTHYGYLDIGTFTHSYQSRITLWPGSILVHDKNNTWNMTRGSIMKKLTWLALLMLVLSIAAPAYAQTVTPPPSPSTTPTVAGDTVLQPDNLNPLNVTAEDAVAFVRFAHVSADAPSVDLYVQEIGDTPLVSDLAYGEVTDFILLPEGNYNIVATAAGTGMDGDVVATINWDVAPNTSWLVSVVGLMSNVSMSVEPMALLRNDIGEDTARVRVVNFISGAQPLTIASDAGDDFGQGLDWMGVFDADVKPGTYNLSVTTPDSSLKTENVPVDLAGGQLSTLLILGSADGTQPVQIVPFDSIADSARVQIVNNSGEAIDIFRRPGDEQVVTSLEAGATSDWISVPSGSTTFVAYAPGTGPSGTELASWIGELSPARDVTVTFGADGATEQTDVQFTSSMVPDAAG